MRRSISSYVQSRGALKRELVTWFAHGASSCASSVTDPAKRRGLTSTPEVLIANAPRKLNFAPLPGHWEGDLITAWNVPAIGTL